jgi:hypothetical protein
VTNGPIIHVEIHAATLDELRDFTDETAPDLGCRPSARKTDDGFAVHAYFPEAELEAARGARSADRVSVRVIENATDVGRARQQEVGQGNRFAARGEIPRGLGRKE